jgi:hypothetical protein
MYSMIFVQFLVCECMSFVTEMNFHCNICNKAEVEVQKLALYKKYLKNGRLL